MSKENQILKEKIKMKIIELEKEYKSTYILDVDTRLILNAIIVTLQELLLEDTNE